uniref:Uncharacterized protein n=1 Tax=Anguilla anguilla TaxID=7936 RepID=A0A0E9Q583_ANGAN
MRAITFDCQPCKNILPIHFFFVYSVFVHCCFLMLITLSIVHKIQNSSSHTPKTKVCTCLINPILVFHRNIFKNKSKNSIIKALGMRPMYVYVSMPE